MKTYKGFITSLKPNQIFVFGSNTEGKHGGGTAKIAMDKFGAIYGQARGLQGQSYAIVTKDLTKSIHPSRTTAQVKEEIVGLYKFALDHPNLEFLIAYRDDNANRCKHTSEELASMFSSFDIPNNIIFEQDFAFLVNKTKIKREM